MLICRSLWILVWSCLSYTTTSGGQASNQTASFGCLPVWGGSTCILLVLAAQAVVDEPVVRAALFQALSVAAALSVSYIKAPCRLPTLKFKLLCYRMSGWNPDVEWKCDGGVLQKNRRRTLPALSEKGALPVPLEAWSRWVCSCGWLLEQGPCVVLLSLFLLTPDTLGKEAAMKSQGEQPDSPAFTFQGCNF